MSFWDDMPYVLTHLNTKGPRPHSVPDNKPPDRSAGRKARQLIPEIYGGTPQQPATPPGSSTLPAQAQPAAQSGANPPAVAGPLPPNPVQNGRNAYLAAMRAMYANRPPQFSQPTLGTRDLAWAIPALLGALSGPNGRQLAGGLISAGLNANRARNNALDQQQMANWQYGQQERANHARIAGQALEYANHDAAALQASAALANKHVSGTVAGSTRAPARHPATKAPAPGGQSPAMPDFYRRYSPETIKAKRDQIKMVANAAGANPDKLIAGVADYPPEVQEKIARRLVGVDAPPQGLQDLSRSDLLRWAYEPAFNFYRDRATDPMNQNPLTEDEWGTFDRLYQSLFATPRTGRRPAKGGRKARR